MKSLLAIVLLGSSLVYAGEAQKQAAPQIEWTVFSPAITEKSKIDTVLEELKCNIGIEKEVSRKIFMGQANVRVNKGMTHIGQTLEGDVLVLKNVRGETVYTLHYCDRPDLDLNKDPKFLVESVLNPSYTCMIDEISATDMILPSKTSPYRLAFFPINMSEPSSICDGYLDYDDYYTDDGELTKEFIDFFRLEEIEANGKTGAIDNN